MDDKIVRILKIPSRIKYVRSMTKEEKTKNMENMLYHMFDQGLFELF